MITGYGWRRSRIPDRADLDKCFELNVAAALFACGVKTLPITAEDEISGKRITEFHFRDTGDLPASVIPAEDPQRIRERFNLCRDTATALKVDAGIIRKALMDHTLEAADPTHPALDVLLTLHARECLLTFMNRGTRYRIQTHPTAARSKYAEGNEPLRQSAPHAGTWTTKDIAIAAAVSRIGCPVLDIIGTEPHRAFVLPRFGHTLPGRFGPEDAQEIIAAFHSGELERQCPEHPVVWGYYGCKARLILLRAIEKRDSRFAQVFMHYKRARHNRSALVEERAFTGSNSPVLNQVFNHLNHK